jgi:3-hydroxyisobutyrate dehydrogenase-like beta-hydroxyacid dehydrogenase
VATVGIISPGAMGSAVGAAYLDAGRRVVTTVDGRSSRTRGLAEAAALEVLADLDAVVAESDLLLSIAPPGQVLAIGVELAAAATRTGARPLVSDWNAVSPATVRELERVLAAAGLELVDGSISGGPPCAHYRTRVYLSGARAAELEGPERLDVRVVGVEIGLASAVKMCTASIYKGFTALLAQALVTAYSQGVLDQVLDDLHDSFPRQIDGAARLLAVSTTKAARYVGEMHEIAATQEHAGLPPALFEAMAAVYGRLARTELAHEAPEAIAAAPALVDVLEQLANAGERT